MKKLFFPLNLQFFAEDPSGTPGTDGTNTPSNPATPPAKETPASFDYEKLAQIIAGKQSVTEDKVLKGFFEQQGLLNDTLFLVGHSTNHLLFQKLSSLVLYFLHSVIYY